MAHTAENQSPDSPLKARLWWLIGGRAVAAFLLLTITLILKRGAFGLSNLSTGVTPIILAVAALTIFYGIAHLALKRFVAQARVQFLFDVLLVTWLVWISGTVKSPYVALYIVVIAVASLFLGPRGAMVT